MRHEYGGRTDAVPHPAQQLLSYTHRFSARGRRARCRCGGTLSRAVLLPPRHAVRRLHRPAAEERQRLPLPGAGRGEDRPSWRVVERRDRRSQRISRRRVHHQWKPRGFLQL